MSIEVKVYPTSTFDTEDWIALQAMQFNVLKKKLDLDEVAVARLVRMHEQDKFVETHQDPNKDVGDRLNSDQSYRKPYLAVAYDDTKPVGWATAANNVSGSAKAQKIKPWLNREYVTLREVAVEEEYQKLGVGSLLAEKLLRMYKPKQPVSVYIWNELTPELQKTLSGYGFVETGLQKKNLLGDGFAEVQLLRMKAGSVRQVLSQLPSQNKPVISTANFQLDPEAQRLHQLGLAAELKGDYATASYRLRAAEKILKTKTPTVDADLQLGRIRRDRGFTHVRRAMETKKPNALKLGNILINQAAKHIWQLMYKTGTDTQQRPEISLNKDKRQFREMDGEYKATVSLLGRVATADWSVLDGAAELRYNFDSPDTTVRYINPRQLYGMADDGRSPSNIYYAASNLMHWARHERIEDNPKQAFRLWLRAVGLLSVGVMIDRKHLVPAIKTVVGRSVSLLRKSYAIKSVAARP